jgi:hypothetical protein
MGRPAASSRSLTFCRLARPRRSTPSGHWWHSFVRQPQSSPPENGNRLAETVMTQGHEHEAMVLDVLKRAVAEALERKRRLGQYAVIWREGHVVCTGPDAPVVPGVPSAGKKS